MRRSVQGWLQSDLAMRIAGLLTLLVVVIVLGATVIVAMQTLHISDNTDASQRTDDLSACRAQYRSDIDTAQLRIAKAEKDWREGMGVAVVAAIRQDTFTLARATELITKANDLSDTAYTQLDQASAAYKAANALASRDPQKFLDRCKENP